jgi:hypothetical protein
LLVRRMSSETGTSFWMKVFALNSLFAQEANTSSPQPLSSTRLRRKRLRFDPSMNTAMVLSASRLSVKTPSEQSRSRSP